MDFQTCLPSFHAIFALPVIIRSCNIFRLFLFEFIIATFHNLWSCTTSRLYSCALYKNAVFRVSTTLLLVICPDCPSTCAMEPVSCVNYCSSFNTLLLLYLSVYIISALCNTIFILDFGCSEFYFVMTAAFNFHFELAYLMFALCNVISLMTFARNVVVFPQRFLNGNVGVEFWGTLYHQQVNINFSATSHHVV